MNGLESLKVTGDHLQRNAYLYVRQSTMKQVFENTESTQRQYNLKQRAVILGWPMERVHVIDSDQGKSAASVFDREGFKKLMLEVSMGNAGIVLGLEVSRLARNCADWHRLLEICGHTKTLILDEEGLYDPGNFNDRLLLGLKGTMSEAELGILQSRMRGGILNKARRGQLATGLPVGFVYDHQKRVQLDPDEQVRETVHLFFRTFQRIGSARGVIKEFERRKILFPRRIQSGSAKGDLTWEELSHSRAVSALHNPRYAGAFFFGRTRGVRGHDGKLSYKKLPRSEWHALVRDAHESYISFEEFEANEKTMQSCAKAYGKERQKSPPREGPALLQGIILCGCCGERMRVHYRCRSGLSNTYSYYCKKNGDWRSNHACQSSTGTPIDEAISSLLLETLTPVALEVAMQVREEFAHRLEESDQIRAKQVQRARYNAELARQRYMQVDPCNRLVAGTLETEWNEKLRELKDVQEEYEHKKAADHKLLGSEEHRRIMELTTDFPRLWNNPDTLDKDRKRMIRLLIEDVTLTKGEKITLRIRFKGGANKCLELPNQPIWERWATPQKIIQEIGRLATDHTDRQIVRILNQKKWVTGKGNPFTATIVARIRKENHLKSKYDRLRESGLLSIGEMAQRFDVNTVTIHDWLKRGYVRGHVFNDKGEHLFEPIEVAGPRKIQAYKSLKQRNFSENLYDPSEEVQYED